MALLICQPRLAEIIANLHSSSFGNMPLPNTSMHFHASQPNSRNTPDFAVQNCVANVDRTIS